MIPFIFEKVKCTESSYLMLSEQEIELLLSSELPCIVDALNQTQIKANINKEFENAIDKLICRASLF